MGRCARLVAWPLLLVGCGGSAMQAREVGSQTPVDSACTDDARPITELGLVARTEYSGAAQAKVVLTNAGARPRRVSPSLIAFCRGPCNGAWTSCEKHRRFSDSERKRYDVSLASSESIELLVDARVDEQRTACEKTGLFLILDVDDKSACGDVGAWIAVAER